MTPTDVALLQDVFWFAFGGCLFALFAYDFIYLLVDFLPDLLRVSFVWLLGLFPRGGNRR